MVLDTLLNQNLKKGVVERCIVDNKRDVFLKLGGGFTPEGVQSIYSHKSQQSVKGAFLP